MNLEQAILFDIYGNTIIQWGEFFSILLLSQLILRRLRLVLITFSRRREVEHGSKVFGALSSFTAQLSSLFLWGISLFLATYAIELGAQPRKFIDNLFVIVIVYQVAICSAQIVAVVIHHALPGGETDGARAASVGLLTSLAQATIWILGILLVLSQFGVNVTTLIAGLGIGGVAVALAVQKLLGDFLASLSIVLDRPFDVNDFVIVKDIQGTVEKVGIRSTRIRSLTGEQIVVPNNDILQGTIRNFKRMPERRVVFSLGVVYDTPLEKLKTIPGLIQSIIQAHSNARFDRAHFSKFGDFSLNFEIAYFVLSADYNVYMDIQQSVNFEIMSQLRSSGIEFAYPTQTLFLVKSDASLECEATSSIKA